MFVQIEKIRFAYNKKSQPVIKDFNLGVNQGEIIAILGESGCGKSTMLRILAGLEEPYAGKISIGGQIMVDENQYVLPEKRGIGMVFQDYALFPHMNVAQNIQYGLKGLSRGEKEKITEDMLKLVKLEEHKHKYPYELSGGQQQRVAIARALAPKPKILLLDEPFSNLDAHLQKNIRDEMNDILRKAGITSIFVTHNKEDAKAIADRVVVLNYGVIEKIGGIEILEVE